MTRIHDFVCDLAKAGKSVWEIMETVEAAYPGKGLSASQVYRLIKDVKEGKDTKDMRGKDSTKTIRTALFIESVKADVEADRSVSVLQLAKWHQVSNGTIRAVLHKDLGLRRKSARWVSKSYVKTCGVAEPVFDKVDTRSLKGVTCHKCGFIASSKEEFQNKAHKCEPIKLFKCLKCDFEAYERSSVRNHDFAVHQKDKALHVCEICGATFSYKCGLTRHLKTHLEKIPCPKCGKIFSRQFTLNRHLDNFHKPTQDHPCEICGKTFKALRYLKRHISSQHPESGELEKHECMHCHSFFREKAYLKKHIRKKHTKV